MRAPLAHLYPPISIMTKNNTWFKVKSYPHIGLPITWQDQNKVIQYIKNPKNIEIHSFCPFIHAQIITPKFRKKYDEVGNLLNYGKRVNLNLKLGIFIMQIIGMPIFFLIIHIYYLKNMKTYLVN